MALNIFYGGEVNIGRRMHESKRLPLDNISAISDADLRIVNLISVASDVGEYNPTELRARPEQINLLTAARIDVVINCQALDRNSEVLIDQNRLLDKAGILHVDDRPVLVRVADQTVALFSVNVADENFSDAASKLVAEVRKQADIVLVTVNWQPDAVRSIETMRANGRALIDCGADGVLGNHPRMLISIDKYKERPIIYGAGFLLHDERGEKDSSGYNLTVDRDGVKRIEFTALRRRAGYTVPATVSLERINNYFRANTHKLGNDVKVNAGGKLEITFEPPPRSIGERAAASNFQYADANSDVLTPIDVSLLKHPSIEPLSEPRPEWIVERVPDDAVIRPQHFGALTLLGCRVEPNPVVSRKPIAVETFWSIEQPIDRSYQLSLRAEPEHECIMKTWGDGYRHEFCNWQFPTDRWTPGVIYREKFWLAPPQGSLTNIDLQLEIEIFDGEQSIGKYLPPTAIEMHLPNRTYIKKEYPSSIYETQTNRLWTPQQIVDATDGEWIVPPPEDAYFQSLISRFSYIKMNILRAPLLFVPNADFWSSPAWEGNLPKKVGGIIVTERHDDVPPDLPQLKVPVPYNAAFQLGVAARRRFRGKVIGITGSSGKTTTSAMVMHIMSATVKCFKTFANQNIRWVPLIFANVPPDAAFAIIEMASSAFEMSRGSISYDITPDIAVVTSISAAHIERHGSLEGIVEVKSKIFCGMSPGGYAILNRDMPYYEVFEMKAKATRLNIISFGTHPEATIRMERLESGGEITVDGKKYLLRCSVPAVQIYDALAAVSVSLASGFSIAKTLERLKSFTPIAGRGNIIELEHDGKNIRIINSTFNANVGSMSGDLEYLKALETDAGRRVAVLGDIAELGEESVERHRELKDAVLDAQADRVLLCGEYMKYLWDAIKDKVNGKYFPTLEKLLDEIDAWLRDGDTVLIKSSHSTHLDRVVKYFKSGVRVSD